MTEYRLSYNGAVYRVEGRITDWFFPFLPPYAKWCALNKDGHDGAGWCNWVQTYDTKALAEDAVARFKYRDAVRSPTFHPVN